MYFIPLGAKESDVILPVSLTRIGSSSGNNDDSTVYHWLRVRDYYDRYDKFLVRLLNLLTDQKDATREEVAELRAHIERTYDVQIDTLMRQYVESEGKKSTGEIDDELEEVWTGRLRYVKAMRRMIRDVMPIAFDELEDIYVYGEQIHKFLARTTGGLGMKALQMDLDALNDRRDQTIDTLYVELEKNHGSKIESSERTFNTLDALKKQIDVRMRLYDSDEQIRLAYSAMGRALVPAQTMETLDDAGPSEQDWETIRRIKALLDQVYDLRGIVTPPPLEQRIKARNVMLEVNKLVESLTSVPTMRYDEGQGRLVFSNNNKPVTTLAPLKIDRIDRVLFELNHRAQRRYEDGEFITSSRRLVRAVPGNVKMDLFLQSSMQRLLQAGSSQYNKSPFEQYYTRDANCAVREVVIEGVRMEVLVATRLVHLSEELLRGYSDSELYKLWENYNDTRISSISQSLDDQRVRNYISILQMSRMRSLAAPEQTLANRIESQDLKIRIHYLEKLLRKLEG